MPDVVARLREATAGRPFTIGALVRPMYVGDPPGDWDLGRATLSGDPDRLRQELADYEAMGVDQVQVRLRSRTHDELVDQLHAFAQEVRK